MFVLFVLWFWGFFPLWEEFAWCCSGEKKNLWSGCKLCFSGEVTNRIVWTQKSADDNSFYIVGSQTHRHQILAIPRPDTWHKFSLNVITVLAHEVHLIINTFDELPFQSSSISLGEGGERWNLWFWIGKIPKSINLYEKGYETARDFFNSIVTLFIDLMFYHSAE